jgi:sulfur-oxidizing protein SoxY
MPRTMSRQIHARQTHARVDRIRRLIVKATIACGLAGLGLAGAAPLGRARAAADASKWPKEAFSQKSAADAIKALYGRTPEESDKINLDAPEIAENGAVVPISVATSLPDVTAISIVVAENPFPLAAHYIIPPGSAAMVANRLKMAKTTKVLALVQSGGKVFSTGKEVKVTVGGCGG